MSKNKYRANATDIWKRPLEIRYIWYVETEEGDYSGTTWQSLNQALNERGSIKRTRLIDISENKVYTLTKEEFKKFLEAWRDNYHNSEWSWYEFFYNKKI